MAKKLIYILSIVLGFGIFVYFYIFNFNSMSETELVQKVLFWYVPLVFGIYGLTALRIHEKYDENSKNALQHVFSAKDVPLLITTILIILFGSCIGGVFFMIPIIIFNPKGKHFDIYTALVGLFLWTLALAFFMFAIFPSL